MYKYNNTLPLINFSNTLQRKPQLVINNTTKSDRYSSDKYCFKEELGVTAVNVNIIT